MTEMRKVTWPDRAPADRGHASDHHLRALHRRAHRDHRRRSCRLVLVKRHPVAVRGSADRWSHRWYAIQTTAGHENKVRSLIQRRIEADPRPAEERPIRQALVPTQEVVEIKNGKKVNVERKIYPGLRAGRDGDEPGDAAHDQQHPGRHQVRRARAAAAAAAPGRGQPPPRHRRRAREPKSRRKRFRSWSVRRSRSPKDRSPTSTARSKKCCGQGQG